MGVDFEEGENMAGLGLGYESVFSGFESFGSTSSSDLSTLVGSERGSTEVESSDEEDDEFMAELSRRMADYMLDDEEEDNKDELEKNVVVDSDSENFKPSSVEDDDGEGVMKGTDCVISTSSVKESDSTVVGYQLSPPFPADVMQPIQLYQVEHQPKVNKSMASRGKKTESTQQQLQNEMCKKMGRVPPNGGGRLSNSNNYGKGHHPPYVGGSGMRAVFLGGVGSRNASSGTGVFLPRSNITPTPHRPPKKSGCSTVLIPTRVLQVLEQHFSNVKSSPPSNGHSSQHGRIIRDCTQEKGQAQSQPSRVATMDHQASQLPQEWTY